MKNVKKSITSKNQLIDLDSYKINEDILYLLNKARTSPKKFSKYIININDDDEEILNLFNFFNNYSLKAAPLILDQNLSICSKDLLKHISSIDLDNKLEIEQKSLETRLSRLNLIPFNYNNFIIIDVQESIDALINLLLNEDYRNTILDPDIKYIGIASGLLRSGNFCVIIDICQSLQHINDNIQKRNISIDNKDNYNNINKQTFNLSTNYTDKKVRNNKRIFIREFNNENNNEQLKNKLINKDRLFSDYVDYKYKYPISVYIKKKYFRDENGNLNLIYDIESNYDDGSILIQPNIDLDYNY